MANEWQLTKSVIVHSHCRHYCSRDQRLPVMVDAKLLKGQMTLHLPPVRLCFQLILATAFASWVRGEPRIINGAEVKPRHNYPWMVSLYFAGCFSNGACPPSGHMCGGAVVNEYYVLTAAHCCYLDWADGNLTIKDHFVLTGLHEGEKLEPWSQNLSVAHCIVHDLYQYIY